MKTPTKRGEYDRGQSVVIGFILIFAITFLGISLYQIVAIPVENTAEENNHANNLADNLGSLTADIIRTSSTNATYQTTFENDIDYTGFMAQPPKNVKSVTASTSPKHTATISGIKNEGSLSYDTRFFSITPEYHYYQPEPEFRFEHSVSFRTTNQDSGKSVATTPQTAIKGNTIHIYVIENSLTKASKSPTIGVRQQAMTEKTITNASNSQLTIKLPTKTSEEEWKSIFSSQMTGNGGHITGVSYDSSSNPNRVIIKLEKGISYNLKIHYIKLSTA